MWGWPNRNERWSRPGRKTRLGIPWLLGRFSCRDNLGTQKSSLSHFCKQLSGLVDLRDYTALHNQHCIPLVGINHYYESTSIMESNREWECVCFLPAYEIFIHHTFGYSKHSKMGRSKAPSSRFGTVLYSNVALAHQMISNKSCFHTHFGGKMSHWWRTFSQGGSTLNPSVGPGLFWILRASWTSGWPRQCESWVSHTDRNKSCNLLHGLQHLCLLFHQE